MLRRILLAAALFVPVQVVKQRLRLAAASPTLHEVYAEDGMTLDQLMAFTVSGDHERQEQVFERLKASYDKQPYATDRLGVMQGSWGPDDVMAKAAAAFTPNVFWMMYDRTPGGFGMDGDLRASIDAGFAAHLTKPVDVHQLDAMIRTLLPQSKSVADAAAASAPVT